MIFKCNLIFSWIYRGFIITKKANILRFGYLLLLSRLVLHIYKLKILKIE